MGERYLKQVIVVNKSLTMPAGKLAAMVAHASMTFMLKRLPFAGSPPPYEVQQFTKDQWQWLTELDPGFEDVGQVSMAKIVCAADDAAHLESIEKAAKDAGLEVHRVVDSGYSHNKPGAFAAIAIGPDWPERLGPVTDKLKIYR